jgi:putative transposase
MKEFPGRLHHNTPSWVKEGASFHIRIRVAPQPQCSLVEPALAAGLLAAAQRYHELGRWWCDLFLIMPDHVHAMLTFPCHTDLTATTRDWKRGTARFQRVSWQENFCDHRIRNRKENEETWHYIRRNPVVKGLCLSEEEWPWWWSGALQKGGTR